MNGIEPPEVETTSAADVLLPDRGSARGAGSRLPSNLVGGEWEPVGDAEVGDAEFGGLGELFSLELEPLPPEVAEASSLALRSFCWRRF